MKRIKYKSWLYFVGFLSSIFFASCDKVNSSASPPSNNMTASIEGNNITFIASGSINNSTITFGGPDDGGDNIRFTIANLYPNYVGKYLLDNHSTACGVYAASNFYEVVPGQLENDQVLFITDSLHTGVLSILSYNPTYQTISGTFSFTGYLSEPPPSWWKDDTVRNINSGTFFVKLNN